MKLLILALALAGDYPPNGQDDGGVAPPPAVTPAKEQPATAEPTPQVSLRLPSTQPSPQSPSLPVKSTPEPGPQAQILRIIVEQAPPPPQPVVQPVTMTVAPGPVVTTQTPVVTTQAPAVTQTVSAKVHRPGPLRRAVGHAGEALSLLGRDRIYLPREERAGTATVALTAAPVQQVVYQVVTAPATTQSVSWNSSNQ